MLAVMDVMAMVLEQVLNPLQVVVAGLAMVVMVVEAGVLMLMAEVLRVLLWFLLLWVVGGVRALGMLVRGEGVVSRETERSSDGGRCRRV